MEAGQAVCDKKSTEVKFRGKLSGNKIQVKSAESLKIVKIESEKLKKMRSLKLAQVKPQEICENKIS